MLKINFKTAIIRKATGFESVQQNCWNITQVI